jgi:hypothetical protein
MKTLRQILKEEVKKFMNTLNEGVDFHIKDYGYWYEHPTNTQTISYILLEKVLKPDSEANWTEEQVQYFKKHSFGYFETIRPDGGTDDVINFYKAGMPKDRVPIIYDGVLKMLAKYGVKIIKIWKERENTEGEVTRIQVQVPEITTAPEMHLAQGNAVELIKLLGFKQNVSNNMLGFDTTDISTEVTIPEMKKGIERAEYYLGEIDKPDDTKMSHQGNVYSFSAGKNQLREYLRTLKEMVAYAEKYGYTKIGIS